MTRGFSYLPKHTAEISHQALAYEKVETKKKDNAQICVCMCLDSWVHLFAGYFAEVSGMNFVFVLRPR